MTPDLRNRLFTLLQKASATLTASHLAHGKDSHGHELPNLARLEREALEALAEAGRIAEAALENTPPARVTG